MTTQNASYKVYALINNVWNDISADIVSTITSDWGITGNTPTDLMANTGTFKFTLKNYDGKYSPGLPSSLSGWKLNIPVKLIISYDGLDYTKFYGTINSIDISSTVVGFSTADVLCVDWFEFATQYSIISPDVQFNKTIDAGITTILNKMPIKPQATNLAVGDTQFPAIFDAVTAQSTAYSEMSKLTFSEIGRMYLRRDRVYGETLVLEDRGARNGLVPVSSLPISSNSSGRLQKEDGGYLLLETGEKIILNQVTSAIMDSPENIKMDYGKSIINSFGVKAYPRFVADSPTVLFKMKQSQIIASGATVVIKGNYTSSEGNPIHAYDLITPVAGTDFTAMGIGDQTFTNLNAYVQMSVVMGTESTTFTITNVNNAPMNLMLLQIRGTGVSTANPIESKNENPTSITAYGYKNKSLDQKYQQNLDAGNLYANSVVALNKDPQVSVTQISFKANLSENSMYSFLHLDIGSLVEIKENDMGIDGNYYIQNIHFEILLGGVINVTWGLVLAPSLQRGLSLVSLKFGGGNSMLNYGVIPSVLNHPSITYTFWINIPSTSNGSGYVMGYWSDAVAFAVIMYYGQVMVNMKGKTGPGGWTTVPLIPRDTWTHVAVTRDNSNTANQPIFYFNGVSVPFTQDNVPVGVITDETGTGFFLGNMGAGALKYQYPLTSQLKDCRVYDHQLNATEINNLYTSNKPVDGLVFQAPCIKTVDVPLLSGKNLTADDKIIDNIYLMSGSPEGTVTLYE